MRNNRQRRTPETMRQAGLELNEIVDNLRRKTKRATLDYQGKSSNYVQNRSRAILGAGLGFLALPIAPVAGILGIAYGGIKAYQASRDKK